MKIELIKICLLQQKQCLEGTLQHWEHTLENNKDLKSVIYASTLGKWGGGMGKEQFNTK